MRFLYPHTWPSKKCSLCHSSQWHSWRHQTSGLKPAAVWLAWAKPMWGKTWANKMAGREIAVSSGFGGPLEQELLKPFCPTVLNNCASFYLMLSLRVPLENSLQMNHRKCNIVSAGLIWENSVLPGCMCSLPHCLFVQALGVVHMPAVNSCLLANLKPPNKNIAWGSHQELDF